MAPRLENSIVTIVAIGGFDPGAAMPQKLADAEALRSDEAAAARFSILIPGHTVEYTLTWCVISVTQNRFAIQTSSPPYVRVADLMQKTLSELMPKASITQLGINQQSVIKFSSAEERNVFGTRLVPPQNWGSWGKSVGERIATVKSPDHGGVVSVTLREQPIAGRVAGWRDAQITALGNADALIAINDHFDKVDTGDVPHGLDAQEIAARTTSGFLRVLREQFDDSVSSSERIARSIVEGS